METSGRSVAGAILGIWSLVVALTAACGGDGGEAPDARMDGEPGDVADAAADVAPDGPGGPDGGDGLAPDGAADVPIEAGEVDVSADGDDGAGGPWTLRSLGDTGELSGMHAVDAGEVYAVGGQRALRYNGRTWATFGRPGEASLEGVWAGEGGVVVVGENGFVARRTAPELGWTVEDSGVEVTLRAVGGSSLDDLWAVGDDGVVLRRTGSGWEESHRAEGFPLHGLWVDPSASGAESVLAVGVSGQLLHFEDGSWRTRQIASTDSTLHAIVGVGDRRFAVGTGAAITARPEADVPWQGQSTNLGAPRDLYALAAAEDDEGNVVVRAFGAEGTVLRLEGETWSEQSVVGPQEASDDLVAALRAPAADAESEARWMALSADGGGLILEADEGWIDWRTRPHRGLAALATGPEGETWAAGPGGLLMTRRPAHGWTAVPSGVDAALRGVAVGGGGQVWAVGAEGRLVRRSAEGEVASWSSDAALGELSAVAVRDGTVVAAGDGGVVLRGEADATSLESWDVGVTADLRAVLAPDGGAWWLAGGRGTLLRSQDGESATAIDNAAVDSLNALTATEEGVLVAGDNGVVLRASAGADEAERLHEEPGLFLYGVSAGSTSAFAVGWNGLVLRRTSEGFAEESSGVSAVLEGIHESGGRVRAVGRLGAVLRREAMR